MWDILGIAGLMVLVGGMAWLATKLLPARTDCGDWIGEPDSWYSGVAECESGRDGW